MGAPRSLLLGTAAGVLIGLGRVPSGWDWVRAVGVDGPTSARMQAAAWMLLAAVLALGARAGLRPRPLAFLAGAGAGTVLCLWWSEAAGRPAGFAGTWAALFAVSAVAALLVGLQAARDGDGQEEGGGQSESGGARVALGRLLGGAGAALAVAALLRPLAHLWAGAPPDGLGAAAGLSIGLLLGALVLGGPLARHRGAAAALGPLATALGALYGWTFLGRLAEPGGAANYLAAFGLDALRDPVGLWGFLIATAALGAAGIAAGATLAAVRSPGAWSTWAAGAALAVLALAYLRDGWAEALDWSRAARDSRAHLVPVLGVALAALGGALASPAAGEARRTVFWVALLGLFAGPALRPAPFFALSPFEARTPDVELLIETAEGLLTVERPPGGGRVATWDRRLLTPAGGDLEADLERVVAALGTVELFGLRPTTPRVLFVGLMTPERSAVLGARSGLRLERTAPFWPYDLPLEGALFPRGLTPPGERIPPLEARRRLREGAYDLVVAAGPGGRLLASGPAGRPRMGPAAAPRLGGLDLPLGTAGVVWIDPRADVRARDLGERVVLAGRGSDGPHLGALRGEASRWPRQAPAGVRGGLEAGSAAWAGLWPAWAARGPEQAGKVAALGLARRLERAAGEGDFQGALARGWGLALAGEWAVALVELAAACRAREGDPLAAGLLEMAALAAVPHDPAAVLEQVLPLAEDRGPWPELERAVAQALAASGRGQEGVERLGELLATRPVDPESWLVRAELEADLDLADAARVSAGRALELGLLGPSLRRRAALTLARAGEPVRARGLARELLLELPGDPELGALVDGRTPP